MATSSATLNDPLGQRDFGGAGVSESPFGLDAGAGGALGSASAPEFDPYAGGNTKPGIGGMLDKQAGNIRAQATTKLRSFADEGKTQVTSTLDGLVTAAREIADKLQDGSFGPVGGFATQAADALEDWTQVVKDKSVEDLLDDGKELVRRSPAVAIGIAVVAGFVLTRIVKAGGDTRYAV